jgi:hypothetical protein
VSRIARQNEALEKSVAQESEKVRQLTSRHKVAASKLKLEKDEVSWGKGMMRVRERGWSGGGQGLGNSGLVERLLNVSGQENYVKRAIS